MEICNIKINIEDAFSKHETLLMEINNCPICGSELEFEHKYRSGKTVIEETATCKSCKINTQTQEFTIQ